MQKKVCMLGAFATGKTSLVQRFVHSLFSEKYHTTVGVKIDRREVAVGDRTVSLLLWDLAGEDDFQFVQPTYLRGAAGLVFVVDGTRRSTIERLDSLRDLAGGVVGDVPAVIALNKSDLGEGWELDPSVVGDLMSTGHMAIRTSAKTGEGVSDAFRWLAQAMIEQE